MDILYLLIPLSAVLVLAIIGVFGWALYRGQFEDLEHEGERILGDEPAPPPAGQAVSPASDTGAAGPAPSSPGVPATRRVDADQSKP